MADAEVGPIGAELFRRDGQLDRLEQGIGRGTHLRVEIADSFRSFRDAGFTQVDLTVVEMPRAD